MIGDLKIVKLLPQVTWKYTKDGSYKERTTTMQFAGKFKVGEIEVISSITLKFDTIHAERIKALLNLTSDEPAVEVAVMPSKQTTLSLDFAAEAPLKTKKVPKGQRRFDDLPQKETSDALDFLPNDESAEEDKPG